MSVMFALVAAGFFLLLSAGCLLAMIINKLDDRSFEAKLRREQAEFEMAFGKVKPPKQTWWVA